MDSYKAIRRMHIDIAENYAEHTIRWTAINKPELWQKILEVENLIADACLGEDLDEIENLCAICRNLYAEAGEWFATREFKKPKTAEFAF